MAHGATSTAATPNIADLLNMLWYRFAKILINSLCEQRNEKFFSLWLSENMFSSKMAFLANENAKQGFANRKLTFPCSHEQISKSIPHTHESQTKVCESQTTFFHVFVSEFSQGKKKFMRIFAKRYHNIGMTLNKNKHMQYTPRIKRNTNSV